MNRILCLGDGYAHGHIWPEWPQILQALLSGRQVEIISGIGAGNEFLINGLLAKDPNKDIVIFQWAQPDRFDKILQDERWNLLAQSDKIYYENFYQHGNHIWWLSSASQLEEIKNYHEFYVQSSQRQQRLSDQKQLVEGFLIGVQCFYLSISTQDQQEFSQDIRFQTVRGKEVQPSPAVHLSYLEEKILPRLPITIDLQRLNQLRNSINQTKWIPYDPDRASIWEKIVSDLDPG